MGKLYSIIIILVLATGDKNNLTGKWGHTRAHSDFGLFLSQKNTSITGSHSSVQQNGNRIDAAVDKEITIMGKVNAAGLATVSFMSEYCNERGMATIRKISNNQIEWKIITPPAGEYHIPDIDTLTKE